VRITSPSDRKAVNILGLLGFVPIVSWVQALIYAFNPTGVVNTRCLHRLIGTVRNQLAL
jgi:hypothetical protein